MPAFEADLRWPARPRLPGPPLNSVGAFAMLETHLDARTLLGGGTAGGAARSYTAAGPTPRGLKQGEGLNIAQARVPIHAGHDSLAPAGMDPFQGNTIMANCCAANLAIAFDPEPFAQGL